MSKQRSVVGSAKLIAICTLLSRFTGLARDVLLAQAFGLRWIQDAFVYAFQVPNLFRRLLGEGAMASVFVPTFTRLLEHEGRESAWRLLARTLALLCVALVVIILAIEAIILVVWVLTPADPATLASRRLLLSLTALMLPFMLTVCVVALLSAILNCLGSFVPAALAPVLLNIAMIVAIAWLGPAMYPQAAEAQIYVVAWAVIIGGVLQIVMLIPVLRANGVPLRWRWEPREASVRKMLKLLAPVALGQGVLVFGVYLDAQVCILLTHKSGTPATFDLLGAEIAYPLEEGALSAITYAQRLYQFPLGVLVVSLATAAMPAFSRLAAREDWSAWAGEVRQSLRLAVFEGLLTGAMMIVLAEPIVRFLFEYRNFTAANTVRAAHVLTFYGLGMWAYCAQHIVLRGFYSLGDVRTPLKISAAVLPLNIVLSLALVWIDAVREAAFAISSALTFGLAVVVGVVILQRRAHARVTDWPAVLAVGRMLLCAGLAGAAVWLLESPAANLAARIPGRVGPRAAEVMGLLAVGCGVFLVAAWLLRLPEVTLLLDSSREKPKAG